MGKGIPGSEYEKLKIRRRHQRFADRLFKFTHDVKEYSHNSDSEEESDGEGHGGLEGGGGGGGGGGSKKSGGNKLIKFKSKHNLKLIKTLNVVNKDTRSFKKKLKKKGQESQPGSRTQTAQQKQFVLEDALRNATECGDIDEMR
jgi:hypothetical protein